MSAKGNSNRKDEHCKGIVDARSGYGPGKEVWWAKTAGLVGLAAVDCVMGVACCVRVDRFKSR